MASTKAVFEESFIGILDFTKDVLNCTQPSEAYRLFESYIKPIGFTGFIYSELPTGQVNQTDFLKIINYITDFQMIRNYLLSEIFNRDVVVEQLLANQRPFTAHDATSRSFTGAARTRYLDVLNELGMADSIAMPVCCGNGRYGISLFSAENKVSGLQKQLDSLGPGIHAIALILHERCQNLRRSSKQQKQLTPRERECLLWAARGKTAWETSIILRVSERTVKFHLKNSHKKLNVYNTTHAVARAVAAGLIFP